MTQAKNSPLLERPVTIVLSLFGVCGRAITPHTNVKVSQRKMKSRLDWRTHNER